MKKINGAAAVRPRRRKKKPPTFSPVGWQPYSLRYSHDTPALALMRMKRASHSLTLSFSDGTENFQLSEILATKAALLPRRAPKRVSLIKMLIQHAENLEYDAGERAMLGRRRSASRLGARTRRR